uniref:Uncharacterized protein n=1 Tax=Photinus pyralis TaxID=7054 RepID=A0A1Y1N9D4_PHOPY
MESDDLLKVDIDFLRKYITKTHYAKRMSFWNNYFEKYEKLIAEDTYYVRKGNDEYDPKPEIKLTEDDTVGQPSIKSGWLVESCCDIVPNRSCKGASSWVDEEETDLIVPTCGATILQNSFVQNWRVEPANSVPSTFGDSTHFSVTILPAAVKSFIEDELNSNLSAVIYKRYCAQVENNVEEYEYWTRVVMHDLSVLSEIIDNKSLCEYSQSALLELITTNSNGKSEVF